MFRSEHFATAVSCIQQLHVPDVNKWVQRQSWWCRRMICYQYVFVHSPVHTVAEKCETTAPVWTGFNKKYFRLWPI